MSVLCLGGVISHAQTAADINDGIRLTQDTGSGEYALAWWGADGRTYFIQHSDDLVNWSYVPIIESGADDAAEYGFTSTASRFFLRLRHTNAPTGGNPDMADFDGDKVGNLAELTQTTDPLGWTDADNDQMPGDWELAHGLNPASAADAAGDGDSDGLTNLAEFQNGADPQNEDTDGDGFRDGYEVGKGANPVLASNSPLTQALTQLAAVAALADAYVAVRAANGSLADRATAWSSLQGAKTTVDELLAELAVAAITPAAQGGVSDAGADLVEETEPALTMPSTASLEGRWARSDYAGAFGINYSQDWMWTGSEWVIYGAPVASPYSTRESGEYINNNGVGGQNNSVQEAMSAPMDMGSFGQGDPGQLSATGYYSEGDPEGGGAPEPSYAGSEEGEMATTEYSTSTPEQYYAEEKEFQLVRSGDGDQGNTIAQTFIKTISHTGVQTTYQVLSLVLAPFVSEAGTLALSGITATKDTTHTESAGGSGGIKEVSFSGASCHVLKSDSGTTTYDAPHWVDMNGDGVAKTDAESGERNYPVAYTKATKPKLAAKFTLANIPPGQSVQVRASSPQGLQLPATALSGGGGVYELSPTEVSNTLTNAIKFYSATGAEPFTIDWEINVGGHGWGQIASTKHTLYVTNAAPITTAAGLMRESLFNIGCRNANGLGSNAQAVVNAIYGEFTDREVARVKKSSGELRNEKMTYWVPGGSTSTQGLLSNGDAQCGGWSKMFIDCCRAVGISNISEIKVNPPTIGDAELKVAIANRTGADISFMGIQARNFGFWVKNSTSPFTPPPTCLTIVSNAPGGGIPGQGNNDPRKGFQDHALVLFGNTLYDPSYGTSPVSDLPDWEASALDYLGGEVSWQMFKLVQGNFVPDGPIMSSQFAVDHGTGANEVTGATTGY